MKSSLFFISFLVILFISCSKENTDMPGYPTCEGCDWNVFTCKVNGENWYADCESNDPLFGCDPVDCQFYPNTGFLEIGASDNRNNQTMGPDCIIKSIDMEEKINYGDRIFWDHKNTFCKTYDLDTLSKNFLRVSQIDYAEKTIEGNFEFTALNECGDTVRITNGYFKLTYRP